MALAQRYRDAFAVLDAIGWRRPDDPPETVDAEPDPTARAEIDQAIAADRAAAIASSAKSPDSLVR